MRVLIATAALLACACAAPSGLLAPYAHHGVVAAPLAYAAPVAHIAPALPTISSGDIAAASIDAHVEASDHHRAAADAAREYHDQASEIHGQQINAAEDHSWQAVDAVKTQEAQLDGAAAGAAPILAKSLVGHSAIVAAPAYAAYAAPAYAHAAPAYAHAAPVAYAAAPAYAHAAPVAYAAPGYSKSVSTSSLSQTHPAPVYQAYAHAAPALAYGHAAPSLAYAAAPLAHAW